MYLTSFAFAILATTATFALPSRLAGQVHHPVGKPGILKKTNSVTPTLNSSWAGAAYHSPPNTWKTVTSIIITPAFPKLPGEEDERGYAQIGIGIDVDTCDGNYVWAGMHFFDGQLSPVVMFNHQDAVSNSDFFVMAIGTHPGDVMRFTLSAPTTTTVDVMIENLSTSESIEQPFEFDAKFPFCLQDVAWDVHAFVPSPDLQLPLADIGILVFLEASATSISGIFGPQKANVIYNMQVNSTVLTDVVAITGESMIIHRLNLV